MRAGTAAPDATPNESRGIVVTVTAANAVQRNVEAVGCCALALYAPAMLSRLCARLFGYALSQLCVALALSINALAHARGSFWWSLVCSVGTQPV